MILAPEVQYLGRQILVLAQEHSILLTYEVAVVHQLLVQVVNLVVSCYHSYAGLGSKHLFHILLQREGSRLEFNIHSTVEDFVAFSSENNGIR